jgi:hypothetical protein
VILLAIISASLLAISVLWVTIVLAAVIVRDSHYVARHAAPARNSYRGTSSFALVLKHLDGKLPERPAVVELPVRRSREGATEGAGQRPRNSGLRSDRWKSRRAWTRDWFSPVPMWTLLVTGAP